MELDLIKTKINAAAIDIQIILVALQKETNISVDRININRIDISTIGGGGDSIISNIKLDVSI